MPNDGAETMNGARRPRKIRVICSDPDATDSSSDELDQTLSRKRIIHEITLDPIDGYPSKRAATVENSDCWKRVLARSPLGGRYTLEVRRRRRFGDPIKKSRLSLYRKRQFEAEFKKRRKLKMKMKRRTQFAGPNGSPDSVLGTADSSGEERGLGSDLLGMDNGSTIIDSHGFLLGGFSRLDDEMWICDSEDAAEVYRT